MNTIKKTWDEIKPTTREEKIGFIKIAGKTIILTVIGVALIYFGCLFS